MNSRVFRLLFSCFFLCALPVLAQVHHPRRSHAPNSPSNDPQLQIPVDQLQFCFTPESSLSGYDQFQQFDSYPQPASRGYLCIVIPPGRTFVIDHLFAEADYDQPLPAPAEWYLNTVVGSYEQMTGFAADRVGASTPSPHYVLSQPVHLAVAGGTRVTLIMHNYFVAANSFITETPGTASLSLLGHWE
ncbi:MAG: hypothetical protein ABSE99_14335 [Terracidiphilus sp.]|jgi:hypothetical protein